MESKVIHITCGKLHSLALLDNGTVIGWDDKEQITIPDFEGRKAKQIACGDTHSLALMDDGTIIGWGDNNNDKIKIPNFGGREPIYISCGYSYSLALLDDGNIIGWGGNYFHKQKLKPITIPDFRGKTVIQIACGKLHSLALLDNGTVISWDLGTNNLEQTTIPNFTDKVIQIACGGFYSLALLADGIVIGWGSNRDGVINIPDFKGINVKQIACGESHSLALLADNTIIGWGDNSKKQIIIPDFEGRNITQISCGNFYSLALLDDNYVKGWGSFYKKQNIIPTVLQIPKPIQILAEPITINDNNVIYFDILTDHVKELMFTKDIKKRIGIDNHGCLSENINGKERFKEGAIDTLKYIISIFEPQNVFIISKAGRPRARETMEWLIRENFFINTNFLEDNVFFCRDVEQKAEFAEKFGIDFLIDDRYEVLKHVSKSTSCYLFPCASNKQKDRLPELYDGPIISVNGWGDILNIFSSLCTLCLEKKNTDVIELTQCSHTFHKNCYEEYIKTTLTNVCPICIKQDSNSTQIDIGEDKNYKLKYIKYKNKYISLKNIYNKNMYTN